MPIGYAKNHNHNLNRQPSADHALSLTHQFTPSESAQGKTVNFVACPQM